MSQTNDPFVALSFILVIVLYIITRKRWWRK